MFLEFHDAEAGNSLAGRWQNIDYDYQAEEIVQEMLPELPGVVRLVLRDDQGERAVWRRTPASEQVTLAWKAERFTGEWRLDLPFTLADHRRKYGPRPGPGAS